MLRVNKLYSHIPGLPVFLSKKIFSFLTVCYYCKRWYPAQVCCLSEDREYQPYLWACCGCWYNMEYLPKNDYVSFSGDFTLPEGWTVTKTL